MPIARVTKCAFSSALNTNGRPWSSPHRRRPAAPTTIAASVQMKVSMRTSAARIGRVVLRSCDGSPPRGCDLDGRRVLLVGEGVLEDRHSAGGDHRDALL